MFCLNCIFVIDAAMKRLVSRSFLKYGVSAVIMVAQQLFFEKPNVHCTRFIKLAIVLKRGSEWQQAGPDPAA